MILLKFNLKDFLKHARIELHDTIQMSNVVTKSQGVAMLEPIHIQAKATYQNEVYYVEGVYETKITYICSRCLKNFTVPLQGAFLEKFSLQVGTDEDVEEEMHQIHGNEILLDPYIEEAVFLAMEYRPLCAKDCRGLCPICGCDWNIQSCDCDQHRIDPRLEVLKDLLSSGDSE